MYIYIYLFICLHNLDEFRVCQENRLCFYCEIATNTAKTSCLPQCFWEPRSHAVTCRQVEFVDTSLNGTWISGEKAGIFRGERSWWKLPEISILKLVELDESSSWGVGNNQSILGIYMLRMPGFPDKFPTDGMEDHISCVSEDLQKDPARCIRIALNPNSWSTEPTSSWRWPPDVGGEKVMENLGNIVIWVMKIHGKSRISWMKMAKHVLLWGFVWDIGYPRN